MGQPVTVDEVMDYLGVGEESRQVVEREMAAALGSGPSFLPRPPGRSHPIPGIRFDPVPLLSWR